MWQSATINQLRFGMLLCQIIRLISIGNVAVGNNQSIAIRNFVMSNHLFDDIIY